MQLIPPKECSEMYGQYQEPAPCMDDDEEDDEEEAECMDVDC